MYSPSCCFRYVWLLLWNKEDNLRKITWDKCIFDAMKVTMVTKVFDCQKYWVTKISSFMFLIRKQVVRLQRHEAEYIFIFFFFFCVNCPFKMTLLFLALSFNQNSIRKSLLHGKLKGVVHPKMKMCWKFTHWRKQYYGSRTFNWKQPF